MKPKLSLKGRALKYLSAREHSRSELKAKLLRHAMPAPAGSARADAASEALADEAEAPDFDDEAPARARGASLVALEALLDELEALKFLSNERFAESLSHRRSERFGVLRLKQELKMHKLPDEIVSATLEDAKLTELQRARDLWARKFHAPAASYEERVKQHRFLASRGFSPSIISQVLKGGFSEEDGT